MLTSVARQRSAMRSMLAPALRTWSTPDRCAAASASFAATPDVLILDCCPACAIDTCALGGRTI